jgi:hypothetical protein
VADTAFTRGITGVGIEVFIVVVLVPESIKKKNRNMPPIMPAITHCWLKLLVTCPWQTLNFFPLPQGQGSFLPTFASLFTTVSCFGKSASKKKSLKRNRSYSPTVNKFKKITSKSPKTIINNQCDITTEIWNKDKQKCYKWNNAVTKKYSLANLK